LHAYVDVISFIDRLTIAHRWPVGIEADQVAGREHLRYPYKHPQAIPFEDRLTPCPIDLLNHFLISLGMTHLTFSPQSTMLFLNFTQTPTEMKRMIVFLGTHYPTETLVAPVHILELFGSPSYNLCMDLLRNYLKGNMEVCMNLFFTIWKTGISYEDFLNELTVTLRQIGQLPPIKSQQIHQMILKGWIYFAQGKTHSLDMFRLLFLEK
jgi:hypothetical protein